MTKRINAHTIANTLFDPTRNTVSPILAPYWFGMAHANVPHYDTKSFPTLEDAAHKLHTKGMSNNDIMILGGHLRHFLIDQLNAEQPSKLANTHTFIATDESAYLGLRLSEPLVSFEQRENIAALKAAYITDLQTLMNKQPGLFTTPAKPKKTSGRRNFGLSLS